MFPVFQNGTVRSDSDLLADLMACRQLRHLSSQDYSDIVSDAFSTRAGKFFCWTADAFALAFLRFGYKCDICGKSVPVEEPTHRKVAERALDNLDGLLKLLCCQSCERRFGGFCKKEFGREVRALYTPDLERMMLAFIASEVCRVYARVRAGLSPEKISEQQSESDDD